MKHSLCAVVLAVLCISSAGFAADGRGAMVPWEKGAWETSEYRNVFREAGYKQEDIDAKLQKAYYDIFEGPGRVYFEVGDDMGYVSDVKNRDVRSEGVSYGMMVAVQLDKKDVFDRIWRWSVKYMQHQDGTRKGYFAWSVNPQTGRQNSAGSASDGELYFITALLFASNRWGNDTGIDYYAEARNILDNMWLKDGTGGVTNVINTEHKMITFVPDRGGYGYTDPSYHVPAFYEVWAEYAKDGHEDFYRECAKVSREFLHKACHAETGLTSDYANFDGTAQRRMGDFGFDSWRVPMNIALDYSWACKDKEWQQGYCKRLQNFLYSKGVDKFEDQFRPDGSARQNIMGAGGYRTLRHSLGFVSTAGAASLMGTQDKSWEFVDGVWNAKLEPYEDGYFDPYYDGLLYLFSLMHLSGNYRIITPADGGAAEGASLDGPIKVEGGLVQGVNQDDLMVFKGVPFAAPPVGDLRWKAPQPVKAWDGVLKAEKFAPAPIQGGSGTSEDCLYLNVWTPAKSADEKVPVLVWIYGGGFAGGATSYYDGALLAKKGVVLVSVAYRVGTLGFLAHPELSAENEHKVSGNYGILDLIASLKWIKNNIAAMGGDPDKVTIFGESAGGIAVSMLCASPLAEGLFEGAISQSGGSFGPSRETTYPGENMMLLADAEKNGKAYTDRAGSSIAEMRKIPADRLPGGRGWPIVDGYVIPDDQYKMYSAGKFNDTPILVGYNSDEGASFSPPRTAQAYVDGVKQRYGKFADKLVAAYPAGDGERPAKTSRDLARDAAFGWQTWIWARLQSQKGQGKAYLYYFDQHAESSEGSPHGQDVAYVFGNPSRPSASDKVISDAMMTYWTNFAKTGNPNGAGVPEWKAFSDANPVVMYFDQKPYMSTVPSENSLKVLDEYFAWRRTDEGAEWAK